MPASLYRKTFLRTHITEALGLNARTPVSRWPNLAAFRDLRNRDAWGETPPTLREFFYGRVAGAGDERFDALYQHVPLVPLDRDWELDPPSTLDDCVQRLSDEHRGIWIQGPNGSGKTVALWRIFHDCVCDEGGTTLHGFVPWRVRLHDGESLWARLAKPLGLQPGPLEAWVKDGPPLLLLCDLDEVPGPSRKGVVDGLMEFLDAPGVKDAKHRVVVAYAGGGQGARLKAANFRHLSLGEWTRDKVVAYARTYRKLRGFAPDISLPDGFPLRPLAVHTCTATGDPKKFRTPAGATRIFLDAALRELIDQCRTEFSEYQKVFKLPDRADPDPLSLHLLNGTTRLANGMFESAEGPADRCRESDAGSYLKRSACDPGDREGWLAVEVGEGFWKPGSSPYFAPLFEGDQALAGKFADLVIQHSPFLLRELDDTAEPPTWFARIDNGLVRSYLVGVLTIRFYDGPYEPSAPKDQWFPSVCNLMRRPERIARWLHPREFCPAQLLGGELSLDQVKVLVRTWLQSLKTEANIAKLSLSPLMRWVTEDYANNFDENSLIYAIREVLVSLSHELGSPEEPPSRAKDGEERVPRIPEGWPRESDVLTRLDAGLRERYSSSVYDEFRELIESSTPRLEAGR